MRIFNQAETAALLPYPALADELALVLRDKLAGKTNAPPRLPVPLPGGVLLLMPATDEHLAITKLASVHNQNGAIGLPVVQADVFVLEAATGRRLMILDGATVTAHRTAAVSLLAARLLAPDTGGPLLIVGAGVQARAHLEAFVAGLGGREVFIAARNTEQGASMLEHAQTLGVAAKLASAEEAAPQASLIVTATTSTAPVLPATVRDNCFIAAVGAYRPDMVEIPADIVRRARVFVDTLEGAQHEAGDLLQAGIDWNLVTALENALDLDRPTKGPLLFKSVGHALWDLAAARLAQRTISTATAETMAVP